MLFLLLHHIQALCTHPHHRNLSLQKMETITGNHCGTQETVRAPLLLLHPWFEKDPERLLEPEYQQVCYETVFLRNGCINKT